MSEYGITPAGFVRKPFDLILLENQKKAKELFGDDINLSVYDPMGAYINYVAWKEHRNWELAEQVYYSLWLDSSTGVSLDRVVSFGGLKRISKQKAVVVIAFSGDINTYIPINFQVETSQGIGFVTLSDGYISESGNVEIMCQCVLKGRVGSIPSNTIKSFPYIEGLKSVSNPAPSYGGREIETDAEIKARYGDINNSTGSTLTAVINAVKNITDVIECQGYENTKEVELSGLPPHSIHIIAMGGNEQAIVEAIYSNKSAGIESYGSVSKTVHDVLGNPHIVSFSRPVIKTGVVRVIVQKNTLWNEESEKDVKTNIIKYIGGIDTRIYGAETIITEYRGCKIGEDLYSWKASASLNDVKGIENLQIFLSKEGEEEDTKISVNTNELIRTETSKVVIEYA